jgi:hypothetical protein
MIQVSDDERRLVIYESRFSSYCLLPLDLGWDYLRSNAPRLFNRTNHEQVDIFKVSDMWLIGNSIYVQHNGLISAVTTPVDKMMYGQHKYDLEPTDVKTIVRLEYYDMLISVDKVTFYDV